MTNVGSLAGLLGCLGLSFGRFLGPRAPLAELRPASADGHHLTVTVGSRDWRRASLARRHVCGGGPTEPGLAGSLR